MQPGFPEVIIEATTPYHLQLCVVFRKSGSRFPVRDTPREATKMQLVESIIKSVMEGYRICKSRCSEKYRMRPKSRSSRAGV
jgi:hypothetical protein